MNHGNVIFRGVGALRLFITFLCGLWKDKELTKRNDGILCDHNGLLVLQHDDVHTPDEVENWT